MASDATTPLAGVRAVEISSFVAVPLAGMTLAQLGCEVTRVDPVDGAADYRRWPLADRQRQRLGNAIYGQYGQNFVSSDGVWFMLVALTPRHFRELAELTGTAKAIDALADALGVDFTDEGSRFRHREALDGLFSVWFSDRGADEIAAALGSTSVLWERYRTFAETAADQRVTANPLFRALRQPRIGEYLAPGLPLSVNGTRSAPVPAPALGDDTAEVLAELGVPAADVQRLTHAGIVR